jgi:hypothetical protein
MAAVVPPPFFSDITLKLTNSMRALARAAINTIGFNVELFEERAGIIPLELHGVDASSGTTTTGPSYLVPFACEVLVVHHCAMTAAGATGTMDLHKALAATPTTFATLQTAATDVKTDVTKEVAASIDDTKNVLAKGDRLRISGVSGSGGALNTQRSTVYLRRL